MMERTFALGLVYTQNPYGMTHLTFYGKYFSRNFSSLNFSRPSPEKQKSPAAPRPLGGIPRDFTLPESYAGASKNSEATD